MVSAAETAMAQPSSGVVSPPQKFVSRSRTQSISSDRPSTVAYSMMSPPLSVSPEAAFIASSAASQIVTNDHDSHADAWYDQHGIEPSGETAAVSPAALLLVNNFLDQLLFNILSISRSTSLTSLRPAVSEVLKPKLAKDAVNQADEELREYLGGDDDDVTQTKSLEPASPSDWDLELVWKRTRLRCMVYSSLGDMEEEDEDYYMEEGHLEAGLGDHLSEVVSPAVAIFLTSILEFMGEQALIVAGQAAYHRIRVKYEKELKEGVRSPTNVAEKIVVEELDMERVALDRTLGRLWRAWKKKIRSPGIGPMDGRLTHSYSKDSIRTASGHLRSPSITAEHGVPATVPEPSTQEEDEADIPQDERIQEPAEEYLVAAAIPLPTKSNDVDEIEVPGLASYSDDEAEDDDVDEQEALPIRPKSMMVLPLTGAHDPSTPTQSQPQTSVFPARKRSNSLPTPAATPYNSKAWAQEVEAEAQMSQTENAVVSDGILAERGPQDSATAETESDEAQSPVPAQYAELEADLEVPHDSVDDVHGGEDEEEDEDETFIEEPQILTSSRISISGRSSSPSASDYGKPTAIITNLPVRSPSVHSARLIDVSSPRSPAVGSRRGSADVGDYIRQNSFAWTSGGMTPPIVEEGSPRSPESLTTPKASAQYSNKSALTANTSIPMERIGPLNSNPPFPVSPVSTVSPISPVVPAGAGLEAIPEPTTTERFEKIGPTLGQRTVGSEVGRVSAPLSPAKPTTKVTILSSSLSSGTFFIEDKSEAPYRPSNQNWSQAPAQAPISSSPPQPPPAPAVPERSTGRQAIANTSAHLQPATIGVVSVERPRTRSPSETVSSRSNEASTSATRPQHTSASSSSSSTTKLKAVRTSEDSGPSRMDVVRNFEELIQSDQTIQYTLTPESMRDIDSQSTRSITSGSPLVSGKARKSEDARQNGDRSRSSSVVRPIDPRGSPSGSRSTGTGSYSGPDVQRHISNSTVSSAVAGKPSGPVPRSGNLISRPRPNGAQARDARMPRESLAEFADFIRSTGPNGPPVSLNQPPASNALRNPGGPGFGSKASIESGRTSSVSNISRLRLQAREAAVDYKDDNSDLIDFIRRGPPSSTGNPRIPRTVAPFRTTMDSDQMSAAVGGRAVDAQLREVDVRSSQASTNATDYSISHQSSINSTSALLGRNKALPNMQFGPGEDDDMPIPKRKTRRVRDPYAIDLSDEDEFDEGEQMPKSNTRVQTQEESLMDFLRSVPPPPEPVVQPFINARAQNQPKKKASAPSLMARFTRRDNGQSSKPFSSGSGSPKSPKSPKAAAAESRSLSSRASAGRGYIPIQVNMPPGVDKYAPSLGGSKAAAMMGGGPPASRGRVPMKRFEPRDAVSVPSRGTSDLAEFFKNSEPPPNVAPQYPVAVGRDEPNGISNLFSRRKKTSAA
ncbi:hypothetical protein B0T26DRAFT_638402 [Lasiosphaeria miniovina]|uniref:Uncharacterized protein n=1 Tax=Lasiosphaeria miniovina TaxID=1954250 RepID=A0AA40E976_9PEZI|nr:uncharacterized protein B0T26DRAFT_638402 [Lasiosphaeria miniovina]KAK0728706.1 hypothetical protein B0T26DRAFT_638402 [Lasiosphaeria miniovina]